MFFYSKINVFIIYANHPCAVGLLPLPREEFRLLKLILHSELRRRAASRRALPCYV